MAAILIEPPASEPVSLLDAKNYLRIQHQADDALIAEMVSAARVQVESLTRRALITQTWRIVLDRWPSSGVIRSPVSPLCAVAAARVRDPIGDVLALDVNTLVQTATAQAEKLYRSYNQRIIFDYQGHRIPDE